MTTDKTNRFWLLSTFILIVIIITASVVIWARRSPGQPIEILLTEPSTFSGDIFVEGAVTSPGAYPLQDSDRISDILQASGGASSNADLTHIYLYIPKAEEITQPQKVDLNRAEAWLLEALPDIGETRAQAIIRYRQENGHFRSLEEIIQVPGISRTTFEKIRPLVTLSD